MIQLEFSFFRVETKYALVFSSVYSACNGSKGPSVLKRSHVVCMTVYIRMHLYLKLCVTFAILFLVKYLSTDAVICFI